MAQGMVVQHYQLKYSGGLPTTHLSSHNHHKPQRKMCFWATALVKSSCFGFRGKCTFSASAHVKFDNAEFRYSIIRVSLQVCLEPPFPVRTVHLIEFPFYQHGGISELWHMFAFMINSENCSLVSVRVMTSLGYFKHSDCLSQTIFMS